MAKGFGIPKRRAVMNSLAESDPALYEELMWLRRYRPNAYRRRVKAMIAKLDELPDLGEFEPLERREGGPMAEAPSLVLPLDRDTGGSTAAQRAAIDEAGGGIDFSVLELTIKALRAALDTGEHDPHLPALIEAEEEGRKRAGALKALEARISEVG